MSVLFKPFNTPHTAVPFSQIKEEDYVPAFAKAIKEALAEIDAITNNEAAPNFENTCVALELAGQQSKRISSVLFNLNSAETNDNLQKITQEVSPMLSEFGNDIRLNEDLYKRIAAVYNADQSHLNHEQQKLLSDQYKMFLRNGANLDNEDKDKLRDIDKQLSMLSLKFGENVLKDTNSYELHITDDSRLGGLPDFVKEAAAETAKAKEKEGYIFTLQYPSYVPFMTYADDRELRKELSLAFGKRGFTSGDTNNEQIILDIVNLRHQRANLLGYDTHAHFVLEERMAKNPETVHVFSQDLLEKAKPAALREFKELTAFASELDGIEQLQKWDGGYYSEKLKKQRFNLDDELLKPYFKLENVIDGSFEIAGKLFGIRFEPTTAVDKYHEDVLTYNVLDENDKFIALFYADFHPREGKRSGAWMTSYKGMRTVDGTEERPHVSIVCNFTKPTETKPSLLTFNEVTTLFHEFGHALHGMLADTTYESLSGTSVSWDFVELPSQLMENWCYEPEALALFAKHYETGEVIPQEYVNKIKEAGSFLEGMATMRQLSFGILDMNWHGQDPSSITSVKEFEKQAFADTSLYPAVEENCMSTAFSHIFQGGYSAGYYSYKWAEVLDADAFDAFIEEGVLSNSVGLRFRESVLSKGGTIEPMKLYEKFRGKKPNADALLKRAGLV